MQYSGKRPAQKSLLCEFRQKTAYKHIIFSLRKVRHKELGPCLALLYLLLYVINNTHSIQEENFCKNLYLRKQNHVGYCYSISYMYTRCTAFCN